MNTLIALTVIFNSYSQIFDLPPHLLDAVCYTESKYDITAIHHDDGGSDSVGVCQIKYKTAVWLGFKGSERALMDPYINSYYAAKYLQYNLKRYSGNVSKAVIAYNRGNAKNLTSTTYSIKVLKQWRKLK